MPWTRGRFETLYQDSRGDGSRLLHSDDGGCFMLNYLSSLAYRRIPTVRIWQYTLRGMRISIETRYCTNSALLLARPFRLIFQVRSRAVDDHAPDAFGSTQMADSGLPVQSGILYLHVRSGSMVRCPHPVLVRNHIQIW